MLFGFFSRMLATVSEKFRRALRLWSWKMSHIAAAAIKELAAEG
jgi:hypothetical protein